MTRTIMIVGLAWAFVAMAGCKRHDEPPPRFGSAGGVELPPVQLMRANSDVLPPVGPDRLLPDVSGRLAAAQPAKADTGGGEAAAVELKDDDPEALVAQYLEFLKTGDVAACAKGVVPEHQEVADKIAAAYTTFAEASKRFNEMLAARGVTLPDEAGEIASPHIVAATLEVVNYTSIDDDNGTATLRDTESNEQEEWKLRRVDGKWRVDTPMFTDSGDADKGIEAFTVLANVLTDVTNKVESGEMEATPGAITPALVGALMSAAGMEPGAEPSSDQPRELQPEASNNGRTAPAPRGSERRYSRSGRDVDNEQPTAEELLGRQ